MKKIYYIPNCGLKLKIERERVIQIKSLQLLFKLQKEGNRTITLQECRKIVEKEIEN